MGRRHLPEDASLCSHRTSSVLGVTCADLSGNSLLKVAGFTQVLLTQLTQCWLAAGSDSGFLFWGRDRGQQLHEPTCAIREIHMQPWGLSAKTYWKIFHCWRIFTATASSSRQFLQLTQCKARRPLRLTFHNEPLEQNWSFHCLSLKAAPAWEHIPALWPSQMLKLREAFSGWLKDRCLHILQCRHGWARFSACDMVQTENLNVFVTSLWLQLWEALSAQTLMWLHYADN